MTDGRRLFLSTLPATGRERRLALAAVVVSGAIFLAAAPFAKVPLAQVWAFVPIYESALVTNDLITAVLLFGQFRILRSRALLVLASGYLFTGCIAGAHALTFPGLFSPTGLLGAGPQTTAWLYLLWHGGFPLLVIAYAFLKDVGRETSRPRGGTRGVVLSSVAAVVAVVCGLTLLATAGQDLLPTIMQGNTYATPATLAIRSSVWALSLVALVALWRRRPHSVLDLALVVVMCAWIFDIALSAVINAGRFDLGFYAGRMYGLLAASFVLAVLLLENGNLYARLVAALGELEEAQEELVRKERLATMGQLAGGVAHEIRNPLGVVKNSVYYLRMVLGQPDERVVKHLGLIERAVTTANRIVSDLLDFARTRPPSRAAVDLATVVEEVLQDTPLPDNVAVRRTSGSAGAEVDPEQVGQIVRNLVTNAAQAMPDGGTLTIETGQANGFARVVVEDTGAGIPPENLAKVFQPLFTTKAKGIGLGLAVAKSLAEANGGTLHAESAQGHGARFVLSIPR